jgi:hypothetical protein
VFEVLSIWDAEEETFDKEVLKSGGYDLYLFVDTKTLGSTSKCYLWVKELKCYRVIEPIVYVGGAVDYDTKLRMIEDHLKRYAGCVNISIL